MLSLFPFFMSNSLNNSPSEQGLDILAYLLSEEIVVTRED